MNIYVYVCMCVCIYTCVHIHPMSHEERHVAGGTWFLDFPPSVDGMLGSSSMQKRASCCPLPFPWHQACHQDQV